MGMFDTALGGLGTLIAGPLGGVLGSLAGGGLDMVNQWGMNKLNAQMQDHYSKRQAERNMALQYNYARLYAQNNPSWQVEGLRAANLNPILTATNGAFQSPTVASVGTSPTLPTQKAPSMVEGFEKLANTSNLLKQNENIESQNDLMKQQVEESKAREQEAKARTLNTINKTRIEGGNYDLSFKGIVNDVLGRNDASSSDSKSQAEVRSKHSAYRDNDLVDKNGNPVSDSSYQYDSRKGVLSNILDANKKDFDNLRRGVQSRNDWLDNEYQKYLKNKGVPWYKAIDMNRPKGWYPEGYLERQKKSRFGDIFYIHTR